MADRNQRGSVTRSKRRLGYLALTEGMISVAFVLVMHQSTGSYTAAGLATGGYAAGAALGLLLAVWSIGSLVGGLLYGARSWKPAVMTRLGLLLSALTIALAGLAAANTMWLLGMLLFVMGMPTAPFTATLNAAVSELAPPPRQNEAFTRVTTMVTTGIAVGNSVVGPVIQLDPTLGFPVAAAAAAAAVLFALRRRHAISQQGVLQRQA